MSGKKMPLKNALQLFLCAFIWGTAFVAQSVGMDYMGPFTMNGIRFLMGALVLLPFVLLRRNMVKKRISQGDRVAVLHPIGKTVSCGIVVGLILFTASTLQQFALRTAPAGKAGFMTAMYIVIVPIISFFLTRKTSYRTWVGIVIAIMGLYFLCINGSFSLEATDYQLLLCALFYAMHIIVIDRLAPNLDGVELSFVQFMTAGTVGTVLAFIFEQPTMGQLIAGIVPLLYVGCMSSGVAYTLQIVGQKGADPSIASLLMSLESVISVLAAWVILGESLTGREIFGCVLMFAAIVLVQLPERTKEKPLAVVHETES